MDEHFLQKSTNYHSINLWHFIVSIAIGLTMLSYNISFAMGAKSRPDGKGLYLYSCKEISRFLKKIGYPDYTIKSVGDITRNSDGTALRFVEWYKRKGIVVTCDGTIKELYVPGYAAWFNDENQAIAWLDKGRVYYKNGMSEEPPFIADYRADPSGEYFMKPIHSPVDKRTSIGVAIYSIERPDFPLVKVKVDWGEDIFLKDDMVLFFGSDFRDRDEKEKLFIFKRKGRKLLQIEKVIIKRPEKSPAPFYVQDLSPWSDEVLFCDVYDFGRSIWYVFNLKSREMKKIGKKPFSGGWGFYLQCDIIKEATKKFKEIKRGE
ncbi:MAG: hypothetical protein JRI72_10635 [Deltaproteobacteria bacterium]|nr:hypothetical protein [Deltaproteobacteria bacterium]